jgi:hypothetical protein
VKRKEREKNKNKNKNKLNLEAHQSFNDDIFNTVEKISTR